MKPFLFLCISVALVALPSFASAAPTVAHSYNWSGYVAKKGTYTSVSGSWTVAPGIDDINDISANAAWVGIGGFDGANNLIQTGTRTLRANGTITYQAWYELFPAPPVALAVSIHPGDTIKASIAETKVNMWRITLTNSTTGESFTASIPYTSNKSSAEWVMERPSSRGKLIALTPFDSFTFSELQTVKNGTAVTPVTAAAKKLLLIGRDGATLLTPSALGSDGRSFTLAQKTQRFALYQQ